MSGVSVSFAIYGSTVDNTTTDSSGDFSKSLNSLGIYTLTYSKSGYFGVNQSGTLATDDQTLVVVTLSQLPEGCLAGTVYGTITDAVSGNTVSGVSISVRSGVNVTSGSTTGITATTDSSGNYSFSSVSAGWYTVQTSKSGYTDGYFNIKSCSVVIGQDPSITTTLSIPDNASSRYHIFYNKKKFYYATNSSTCSGCDSSDNVTLDRDDQNGAPGTETITITKIRSGIYRYSVHDFTNRGTSSSTKLATS